MHVRAARFEGIDTANIDRDIEEFRKMVRMEERPEGMPEETYTTLRDGVKRVMSLVDREAGASLDLVFTATAEDAQRVHEALDSLTPPEGAGKRTSVQSFELLLDEDLELAPRARVTARTRIRNVLIAVTPRRSLASRVTTCPPGAFGVPVSRPNAEARRTPRGRRPWRMLHTSGPTPPAATSSAR